MGTDKLKWWLAEKALKIRASRVTTDMFVLAVIFCAVWLVYSADPAFAYSQPKFEGKLFSRACKAILKYQDSEGLASLLAAVAGMGAIVSAAIGGFRMAWALVVVAMGSIILGHFVKTFVTC